MSTDVPTPKPGKIGSWSAAAFAITTAIGLGGLYYTNYYGDRELDLSQKSYDLALSESREQREAGSASGFAPPAPGQSGGAAPSGATAERTPGAAAAEATPAEPVLAVRPLRQLDCMPLEPDGATMAMDCPLPASGRLRVEAALTSVDRPLVRYDIWAVVAGRTCNETTLGPNASQNAFDCTLPESAERPPRTVRIRVRSPTQSAALPHAADYVVTASEIL